MESINCIFLCAFLTWLWVKRKVCFEAEFKVWAYFNSSCGEQIKQHMVFTKFTSSGHWWTNGGGVWFLADTRGKCWRLTSGGERKREERGGDGASAHRRRHPLRHTSSFPRYLVCFQAAESVTGSFLVSWLQPVPGGSRAGLRRPFCCSKTSHRPAWPTGWDFHFITTPLPNPLRPATDAKAFPFLLSHSPPRVLVSLWGATVAVNSMTRTGDLFHLSTSV